MISASEAKKATQEFLQSRLEAEMVNIKAAIEAAINKGQGYICVTKLSENAHRVLTAKGYKVNCSHDPRDIDVYEVSWL